MSWRSSQGITGTNNIPLGRRRGFDDDETQQQYPESAIAVPPPPPTAQNGQSRGRSPVRSGRVKKKCNRWGAVEDNKALGLIGLPTAITSIMTTEQIEAYALHIRLEEIGQKLRIGDVTPPEKDRRSVSPPPQYDNFGRRINTRESRYRKKLEDERHRLVERAMRTIPDFKPPADYRRPTKTQEKIYIPVNDYPEINFIGLLIGPRGNTLKKMETDSGAKIAIRGKGSVKEGKGRSDAAANSNLEEDLHCLVMADNEDKVKRAVELIQNVIETAASIPETQNDLKRAQLRELATLNGTLRDDENQTCQNCGNVGHRRYDCPEIRNYSANIVCRACGQAGHIMKDCPEKPDAQRRAAAQITSAADREYESLMQELGGGGGQNAGRMIDMGIPQPVGQTPWAQPANPWAKALPAAPVNPWGSAPQPMPAPVSAPVVPPVQQQMAPPGMSAPSVSGPPGISAPPGMSSASFGAPPSLTAPPGIAISLPNFSVPPPPPPPGR